VTCRGCNSPSCICRATPSSYLLPTAARTTQQNFQSALRTCLKNYNCAANKAPCLACMRKVKPPAAKLWQQGLKHSNTKKQ
jgi:ribosomal protein S20